MALPKALEDLATLAREKSASTPWVRVPLFQAYLTWLDLQERVRQGKLTAEEAETQLAEACARANRAMTLAQSLAGYGVQVGLEPYNLPESWDGFITVLTSGLPASEHKEVRKYLQSIVVQSSLAGLGPEDMARSLSQAYETWVLFRSLKPSEHIAGLLGSSLLAKAALDIQANVRESRQEEAVARVQAALDQFFTTEQTRNLVAQLGSDSYRERSDAFVQLFQGAASATASTLQDLIQGEEPGPAMSREEAKNLVLSAWLSSPTGFGVSRAVWENLYRPFFADIRVDTNEPGWWKTAAWWAANLLIDVYCLNSNLRAIAGGLSALGEAGRVGLLKLKANLTGGDIALTLSPGVSPAGPGPSMALGFVMGKPAEGMIPITWSQIGLLAGRGAFWTAAGAVFPPFHWIVKALIYDVMRLQNLWDSAYASIAEAHWLPAIEAFIKNLPEEDLQEGKLLARAQSELFPALQSMSVNIAEEVSGFASLVGYKGPQVAEVVPALQPGETLYLSPEIKDLLVENYGRELLRQRGYLETLTLAELRRGQQYGSALFPVVRVVEAVPAGGLAALLDAEVLELISRARSEITRMEGTSTVQSVLSWPMESSSDGFFSAGQFGVGRSSLRASKAAGEVAKTVFSYPTKIFSILSEPSAPFAQAMVGVQPREEEKLDPSLVNKAILGMIFREALEQGLPLVEAVDTAQRAKAFLDDPQFSAKLLELWDTWRASPTPLVMVKVSDGTYLEKVPESLGEKILGFLGYLAEQRELWLNALGVLGTTSPR